MALVFADRVKESSTTVGTGTFTLDGALTGFRTFLAAIGAGNSTHYTIVHDADGSWEVGIGTVTGSTLSRDSVLASSNGGALVNFAAGSKTVFAPATAQSLNERITQAEHAALDHTGIPGVPAPEAFTQAVHAVENHAGLPGVPAPESFTQAVHDLHDHTGLPGIPPVGPVSPQTDGAVDTTAAAAVDLTASTSTLHYLSADPSLPGFSVLDVLLPPAPTQSTPFFVLVNADKHSRGGSFVVKAGTRAITVLRPKEAARLWHTGNTADDWIAERFSSDEHWGECLYRWFDNTNIQVGYLPPALGFTTTPQPSRDVNTTDFAFTGKTKLLGLAWLKSGGTPAGTAELRDKNDVTLATIPLGAGATGGIEDLDLFFDVDESVIETGTPERIAAFCPTADQGFLNLIAYGFQRDGGSDVYLRYGDLLSLPVDCAIDAVALHKNSSFPTPPYTIEIEVEGEVVAQQVVNTSLNGAIAVRRIDGSRPEVPRGAEFTITMNPAPIGSMVFLVRLRPVFGAFLSFEDIGSSAGPYPSDNPSSTVAFPFDVRLLHWYHFANGPDGDLTVNGLTINTGLASSPSYGALGGLVLPAGTPVTATGAGTLHFTALPEATP